MLDWKIKELIKSERIQQVVVTSPSLKVKSHLEAHYDSNAVKFIHRNENLAQLNTGLVETLNEALEQLEGNQFDYLMVLGVEYPYINFKTVNDAINTLAIFEADSLISVRPETNLFFRHDGEGMKPILNMDKFTKLERDALYRNIGGITLTKLGYFKKHQTLLGGKVGHIVIGQKESLGIFSKYELKVANAIVDL